MRERIVEMVTEEGKSMHWVARTLKYPRSTVRNIVNTFFDTDRIHKLPRGGRRNVKLEVEHLDWLTDKLDEFAGRPVAMLTQELNEHFEFDPPITERAVDKALNKHTAYTLKLMRVEPERYNDPEYIHGCRQWARRVLNGPGNMNHFVYIDEAGFNLHITRKYGRAPRGRRAFQVVPYNRGPNQSLVIAVDSTGILAWHFKPRAYNQVTFTEFLEEKLFPVIEGRHRVLLMDNARFHKTQHVKNAIDAAGHTLLLLPPYSPHLNAAKSVFSSVKTHVRKEVVEELTLTGHVQAGLERITDAMARGWIREVGRNFEYALQGEPLGRLYNTRDPIPNGYQDPYIEGWDMEEEWEDDDERREDPHENAAEQEGEVKEEEGDEEEDEEEEDEATPPPPLTRKYSPNRTRSGKERN